MKAKTFKQIEAIWYRRLKKSGFDDIEDLNSPDRQLLEWHSFKFTTLKIKAQKEKAETYQARLDAFSNRPDFIEIINQVITHGNSIFKAHQVIEIWDLHRMGQTERAIAEKMGSNKSCIHFLLKRIKNWMNLV